MNPRPPFLRQINGGERIDTSRICCDQLCQQGRDCPLDRRAPVPNPSTTVDAILWVMAVALLGALIFAALAPIQAADLLANFLGL